MVKFLNNRCRWKESKKDIKNFISNNKKLEKSILKLTITNIY